MPKSTKFTDSYQENSGTELRNFKSQMVPAAIAVAQSDTLSATMVVIHTSFQKAHMACQLNKCIRKAAKRPACIHMNRSHKLLSSP